MIMFENFWPSRLYPKNGPKDCLYAKSPNGYIDEELFLEWFKKIYSRNKAFATNFPGQ